MQEEPSVPLGAFLAAAAVLVALSMIFSATESAFLSINKLRVRLLRNKKNRRAARVWRLLNKKDRLINTLLAGNNIVNIALSAIFTYIAIRLFGDAGVGIATFAVTLILLVFGEISPKTFATRHPEPLAFFFSGLISALEVALSPVVAVLTRISALGMRLMGIEAGKKSVSFTEEEIKTFLDVGHEQGVIEKNENTMMHRVFKFTDLEAKDIMIPRKRIKAISRDETYQNIIELSQQTRLSRFPVCRNGIDDIIGILYVKDLLAYKNSPENFSVRGTMRPPLYILGTKKMSGIQQMFRENRQSMAVVIDEYSGTEGILTVEDLVREIFGPVSDGYKPFAHKVEVRIKNPRNAEIDGLSRLIDINEQIGTSLESDISETIGGYICEKIGNIPQEGASVTNSGYRFTVLEMEDNRVSKIRIQEAR